MHFRSMFFDWLDDLISRHRSRHEAEEIQDRWADLDAQYVAIANAGGNDALHGDYGDPVFGAPALAVNQGFVDLALDYLEYLEDGGRALTDVYAKTGGGRLQSFHDNILGNITEGALEDRQLLDDYAGVIPAGYLDRAYYSGNATAQGGAAHDAVRVFDYEHGFRRPDYVEADHSGALDASARDGDSMIAGSDISAESFAVVRHEGAGVELGLDVIYRQGPQADQYVGADGLVHFDVATGTQSTDNDSSSDHPGRAAWNFNYSIATGLNGTDEDLSDFKFVMKFDTDITDDIDFRVFEGHFHDDGAGSDLVWVDKKTGQPVIGDDDGNGNVSQNSQNVAFGFLRNHIDGEPEEHPGRPWWSDFFHDHGHGNGRGRGNGHDPIDPYNFGEAEFDIVLQAYDDGRLIASNHIVVNVDDPLMV